MVGEVDDGGSDESNGRFSKKFRCRVELLWKFLDSTSVAFKDRDCVEWWIVEGEAARVLEWGRWQQRGGSGDWRGWWGSGSGRKGSRRRRWIG